MNCCAIRSRSQGQFNRGAARAFTLLEVILAIVIALGILVVLLYFYEQATNLRAQVIQETERISSARLIMDRLTQELRASQSDNGSGQGFVGESNSLQFVRTDVPSFAAWTGGAFGRSSFPITDLKLVSYRLESSETNVSGLVRSEEPLISPIQRLTASEDQPDQTNMLSSVTLPPVLEEIRFLQFRYWSGTNWLDAWSSPGRPDAVEVSLGAEPWTNTTDVAEPAPEIFRRVIYLANASPMAGLRPVSTNNSNVSAAAPAEEGTP
jgi:type II secretory pathway component PulJ